MTDHLIIPSEIPWDELRGADLEECVYWLIDAMGGKDLEWRLGGKGQGAPDQGRDLETFFYMPDPDGELIRQKWWIEVKGRKGTVEPTEIKGAVLNAAGKQNIDVLVFATNTTFSNPTRDWVKEWQIHHPRPTIRLWDRSNLEKLCSKHPTVVIRLFSKALSAQGRLDVVRSKFWNYSSYSNKPTLKYIWKHRKSLTWAEDDIISVLVSETANGNIITRPWALTIDPEDLFSTLTSGLLNLPYFCQRANQAGTDQHPYIKGIAYLLLVTLRNFPAEMVGQFFSKVWDNASNINFPDETRKGIIKPILGQLIGELQDVCTSDCSRISSELSTLTKDELECYWDRLRMPADDYDEEEKNTQILIIESLNEACKIGFEVDNKQRCPIVSVKDIDEIDIDRTLITLEQIIRSRSPK